MARRKRLLAIVGVFPPFGGPGAIRLVKLFRHLPEHGWDVEVIAPAGRAGWYRDPELTRELGPTTVHRVGPTRQLGALTSKWRAAAKDPSRSGWWLSLLQRWMRAGRLARDLLSVPDEYLLWAAAALVRARSLLATRRYDALFTSSFPYSCHLAGLGLALAGGPPWLVELRDPWLGHQFRLQSRSWRRPLDAFLERQVIEHAKGVIAVTPGIAELLASQHGEALRARLSVVTNGFDPADFAAPGPRAPGRRLELLYVGTFEDPVAPPDTILAALDGLLRTRPNAAARVVLRILGGADLKSAEKIRRWNERHSSARMVVLEPFRPHAEATAAMVSADALVLSVGEGAPWVLTSKVFEYLGSGRPILAVVPRGDCRELLMRCGGATLFQPDEAGLLAKEILGAIDRGEVKPTLARDEAAIRGYALPSLAQTLATRLDEVARG